MSEKFKFYYRLFFTLLGWAAIIVTLYFRITRIVEAGDSLFSIYRPWLWFTIQSNTLVLLYWTFSLFYFNKDKKPFFLRPAVKGGIAVYITVTFIIYGIFLAGLRDLQGIIAFREIIYHYVTPIAFIVDYFVNTKKKSLRFNQVGYWTIYPVCYLIFSVINGAVNHLYVYPFLNIERLGWTRVSINAVCLLLFFAFIGFIYVLLNRRLPERQAR